MPQPKLVTAMACALFLTVVSLTYTAIYKRTYLRVNNIFTMCIASTSTIMGYHSISTLPITIPYLIQATKFSLWFTHNMLTFPKTILCCNNYISSKYIINFQLVHHRFAFPKFPFVTYCNHSRHIDMFPWCKERIHNTQSKSRIIYSPKIWATILLISLRSAREEMNQVAWDGGLRNLTWKREEKRLRFERERSSMSLQRYFHRCSDGS